jgi:hypothetical protein
VPYIVGLHLSEEASINKWLSARMHAIFQANLPGGANVKAPQRQRQTLRYRQLGRADLTGKCTNLAARASQTLV